MWKLYLHSPICLHGVVLNKLSKGITLIPGRSVDVEDKNGSVLDHEVYYEACGISVERPLRIIN
jgi:hypothetical protein